MLWRRLVSGLSFFITGLERSFGAHFGECKDFFHGVSNAPIFNDDGARLIAEIYKSQVVAIDIDFNGFRVGCGVHPCAMIELRFIAFWILVGFWMLWCNGVHPDIPLDSFANELADFLWSHLVIFRRTYE